jgi:hypothetical protein
LRFLDHGVSSSGSSTTVARQSYGRSRHDAGADPTSLLTMKPLQGVSFERDVSFRNIGISAPNNFHCLRARHDRGAPAVPLAKELAERDSFASRDSYVFLALSA